VHRRLRDEAAAVVAASQVVGAGAGQGQPDFSAQAPGTAKPPAPASYSVPVVGLRHRQAQDQ
jgi:hypothetical protein